jgi:hypothetical protein
MELLHRGLLSLRVMECKPKKKQGAKEVDLLFIV